MPPRKRVVSVELADADLSILADVRSWVDDLLTDAATPRPAILAVLHVFTELATNALTHGAPAGQCRLHLSAGETLRIEVDDHSPRRATIDDPHRAPGRGRGLGLLIVQELARAWGQTCRSSSPKTVWAEVCLR